MEALIEDERKKQFQQYEEIIHLKNENQELVIRASRKQSEMNLEDSKTYGYDSNLRANLGGLPYMTMPKRPSVPHMTAMPNTTTLNPMSTQSIDIEERLRDITSQLDKLDPGRR